MGEKESVIDVRAKGMRITFAAMRMKASEGELQRAMQVGEVLEGLRKSIKLRAREMRSIAKIFGVTETSCVSVLHGYSAKDDESPGRDELHALHDGRGEAGVVVL